MKIVAVLIVVLFSLCTSGCVTTQLHAVLKEMTHNDEKSEKEVDQPTLDLIQLLRAQQNKQTRTELFTYNSNNNELRVIQFIRFKRLLVNWSSEITIYVAPASTGTDFQKILLVNKRVSMISKFLSIHKKDAEVIYAPTQKTNTVKVVLGS